MATIECAKVEVTTRLLLSKRELELLHHICSYDNKEKFAKGAESSHYHGGVKASEIVAFMEMLRKVTGEVMHHLDQPETKIFRNAG